MGHRYPQKGSDSPLRWRPRVSVCTDGTWEAGHVHTLHTTDCERLAAAVGRVCNRPAAPRSRTTTERVTALQGEDGPTARCVLPQDASCRRCGPIGLEGAHHTGACREGRLGAACMRLRALPAACGQSGPSGRVACADPAPDQMSSVAFCVGRTTPRPDPALCCPTDRAPLQQTLPDGTC